MSKSKNRKKRNEGCFIAIAFSFIILLLGGLALYLSKDIVEKDKDSAGEGGFMSKGNLTSVSREIKEDLEELMQLDDQVSGAVGNSKSGFETQIEDIEDELSGKIKSIDKSESNLYEAVRENYDYIRRLRKTNNELRRERNKILDELKEQKEDCKELEDERNRLDLLLQSKLNKAKEGGNSPPISTSPALPPPAAPPPTITVNSNNPDYARSDDATVMDTDSREERSKPPEEEPQPKSKEEEITESPKPKKEKKGFFNGLFKKKRKKKKNE